MKNLFILLFFLLSISLTANELQWVDEQIQAIKPPRNAISKAKIDAVKNPFIFLHKTSKKRNPKLAGNKKSTWKKSNSSKSSTNKSVKTARSFSLDAIINKSALINGKWYKINSKIGRYTLSSVNTTSVVLSYRKKEIRLSTRSGTNKIKFRNN